MNTLLGIILGFVFGCAAIYLVKKNQAKELQKAKDKIVKLEAQKHAQDQANQSWADRFELMSKKALESQEDSFNKKQKASLDHILSPFKEEITNFKKKIEDTNKLQSESKGKFEEQFKHLMDMNKTLSTDANNLTEALKGNSKIQGDWGETQLKRVLDITGLRDGIDYYAQPNLKDDDGNNLRPDYIVKLPGDKNLVIDSKVSLTNYADYCKEEDKDKKKDLLHKHVSSIKKHISSLSNQEYHKYLKKNSLDYVFMFIPVEQAYIEALKEDNDIYENAYKNNVMITTPSSLLPILRSVENIWNLENRNNNIEQIADAGGKLYDKLDGFVKDMKKIDTNLDKAKSSYEEAFKKLSSGRGNAINLAEKMKDLGAKTNKQIDVEETLKLEKDDK